MLALFANVLNDIHNDDLALWVSSIVQLCDFIASLTKILAEVGRVVLVKLDF